MRICGIELKSNEAIFALLAKQDELFDVPDCRMRKLSLDKPLEREALRHFQFTFAKLMDDYKVDKVIIKERPLKGKFAGSAAGFKMEAAIQLCTDFEVNIVPPVAIKEALRGSPLPIRFADTGLKSFQETAFMVAYASLC